MDLLQWLIELSRSLMADGKHIAEAVRLVSAVEGVIRVESWIVSLAFHPGEF